MSLKRLTFYVRSNKQQMPMTHKKKVSVAVAVSVIVAAVGVVAALYFTNVLVPRYRCKDGACVADYMGSIKDKHFPCSQTLYTNPSLIFNTNDPTLKDQGVTNGSGVLSLGYVDTSKLKAGDLITWDISATAQSADGNKVCLAGALVNTAAFFGALDSTFIWGDGPAPGQWPWNAGVFNHSFPGPIVDPGTNVLNGSRMTRLGTDVINKTGVFFLGDKIDTNPIVADFPGGPVGTKSGRCTRSASAAAKLDLGVKSAVLQANGIGPDAYLAFLWFTHTTTDPITFSITKDSINFTTAK